MDKYAKMIGAAQGGLTSAAAVSAMALVALNLMPDAARESVPWWGYLLIFLVAAVVCVFFPALTTWAAPANTPQSLPAKIDVPATIGVTLSQDADGQITAATGRASGKSK